MLWLFVIIGLVTSGSVLRRLSVSAGARRWFWLSLAATALLLVVAWAAQHTTAIGWCALLIAFIIEAVQWTARRASRRTTTAPLLQPIAIPQEVQGSPEAAAQPDPEPRPSDEIRSPPRSFTTVALLRTAWEPAAEVFLASLRRTGQRDAGLSEEPREDTSDRIRVRVGTIRLELATRRTAVTQSQIDYAVEQAWDWPGTAEHVAGHSAHVTLTTQCPAEAAPCAVVQLHHRAHSALAEFAPVVGILWPDASRLMPVTALADLCQKADNATQTRCCVSFRVFPSEDIEARGFVADTVGLHAFGLPDLQITTEREPDEAISAMLYDLAERFFVSGCELDAEGILSAGDGERWHASRGRARFAPDRDVLVLAPATPSDSGPPAEDRATGEAPAVSDS